MSKLEVVMEEMTNAQLVRLDKRIDGQVYFFFQGFRHGYFAASNREGCIHFKGCNLKR